MSYNQNLKADPMTEIYYSARLRYEYELWLYEYRAADSNN